MKTIRFNIALVGTLIRDRFYYPDRLLFETITMIGRCLVLLLVYSYVFSVHGGTIEQTTFPVVAWSMFFYFAFSALRLRDISRVIMQDVQSGNVEVLFNKPISYLSYRMWWQVGIGVYQFVVIFSVGACLLGCVIGMPDVFVTKTFIPTFLMAILSGGILSLFLYTIVGLLAFWIEDINPIFWIIDKFVMVLGGSYLPIALFPKYFYAIALWSPFGASQFISHTVYASWKTEWAMKIGIQLCWIMVLGIISTLLFARARKKISVNGG